MSFKRLSVRKKLNVMVKSINNYNITIVLLFYVAETGLELKKTSDRSETHHYHRCHHDRKHNPI